MLRLDERAVELGERPADRVGVAREARGIGGRGLDDAAQDERSLRVADQPSTRPVGERQVLEQRVEGPDRPREQPAAGSDELPFEPLDVGAVRDDQPGIAVERGDEAVEQVRDLPACAGPTTSESPTGAW